MKIKHLMIFLFFLVSIVQAQVKEVQVVAEIGEKKITKDEFVKRYEMMPQLNRERRYNVDEQKLKQDLLFSVIAEKLWALEAASLGYDTTAAVNYSYKNVEKMYVRDALYKIEVTDNAKIKKEEVEKAIDRMNKLLKVNYIYSLDEKEIFEVYNELEKGVPFDSVLSSRTEKLLQPEPYDLVYGKMEEFVEDSIFSLEFGEYTSPIKSPDGWYIFKLIEVGKNPEAGKDDFQKNINKILEQRATDREVKRFYSDFFFDKEVTTDGDLFWYLSEKLYDQMKKLQEAGNISAGEQVTLSDQAFYNILHDFGNDTLNMNFIKFIENPVTLKEFLYGFIFEGFSAKRIDLQSIRRELDGRVKKYIEQTLIAREGFKRGLDKLPEVREELEMWKDHYLSVQLKKDFIDSVSVSDEELKEFYSDENNENISGIQLRIIEVVNHDLGVIEKVLYQLDKGAKIEDLAAVYSQQKSDTITFSPSERGELGVIASQMEEGEIYGPVETENGYSIFKLIDKTKTDKNLQLSANDNKEETRKKLEFDKFKNMIKSKTASLAEKYGVEVNINALNSINVTNLSMLVFRYFGFGGRMIAVPMTLEFSDWVEEWDKAKSILP